MKKILDYIIWEYGRCLQFSKQNFEDFISSPMNISEHSFVSKKDETKTMHYIDFIGGLNGRLHVISDSTNIEIIAKRLLGDLSGMSPDDIEAIHGEICNIFAGNVIGHLANKIDGRIDLSVPFINKEKIIDISNSICSKAFLCQITDLQIEFVLLVEFTSIGDLSLIQNMVS